MKHNTSYHQQGIGHLVVLLVLVIAIGAGAGWYVWHANQAKPAAAVSTTTTPAASSSSSSSRSAKPAASQSADAAFKLPAGWSWYSNSQYGFKLAHPAGWGDPTPTRNAGNTGYSYSLDFRLDAQDKPMGQGTPSHTLTIGFDSDDMSSQGCKDSGKCDTVGPQSNKTQISQALAQIKSGTFDQSYYHVAAHDSVSYATVVTGASAKAEENTDTLEVQRIVSLPSLKVSGAFLQDMLFGAPATCTQNALSAKGQAKCPNPDYLAQDQAILSSLQTL